MTEPAAARDSSLSRDVIGGVTTFFTMAYIVVVNPSILATPGTGMPFSGAMTATVLVACSMTFLMGVFARLPFAVAPGMGLNAFFAFTIVLQGKVPWQTALGIVFWAGRAVCRRVGHASAGSHRAGDSRGVAGCGGGRHPGCC
jgi:AGZA family xanthine/uracil permease-like MFS transporter